MLGFISKILSLFPFFKRQYSTPLADLKRKAKCGDIKAQFKLAICYLDGIGCKKNHAKAFQLWKKAAELGDIQSQYNLGVCYKYGEGVARNPEEAFKW